jgi:hypothetical protein
MQRVHMSRSAVAALAAVAIAAAAASPSPAEAFVLFVQPHPTAKAGKAPTGLAPNRSSFAPANKGASSAAKAQANVNTGQGPPVRRVWIVKPGLAGSQGGSSAGSGAQSTSSGSGSGGSSGGGSSLRDILKEKLGEVFKAKIDELLKLPSK